MELQTAQAYLQRALANKALFYAYLFIGPAGIGKTSLAQELAQAVLCSQTPAPCYQCSSCRKVQQGLHPDVTLITPGAHQVLTIDKIRGLAREASLKPWEGRCRVFIITQAHSMNPEAANCLLKTLEEPPGETVFVLTTDQENRLLDTIRSRCQLLYLAPPPAEQLEAQLCQEHQLSEVSAQTIARLAGGSLVEAQQIIAEQKLRDFAVHCLQAPPQQALQLAEQALELCAAGDDKNATALRLIHYLMSLLRDALLASEPQLWWNRDQADLARTLQAKFGKTQLWELLHFLEQSTYQMQANVRLALLLENVFLQITHSGQLDARPAARTFRW